MKKYLIISLLFIFILTGCKNKENKNIIKSIDNLNSEEFNCIEKELNTYILSENDKLIEIPINDIKNKNIEKIDYYKSVYSKNNKDNMYIIVFPKKGLYEFEEMKYFDNYFNNKFDKYQKFESPLIPTIYIHTNDNNVDINEITNKCIPNKDFDDYEYIPTTLVEKINMTNKIIIKSGDKVLGEVNNKNNLNKIINSIKKSKRSSKGACLSDMYAFSFEMYDNDILIDTFYVWYDGKRVLPASFSEGCYYGISYEFDLRKIIEEETNFIFYSILDFRDSYNDIQKLIYTDGENNYYLIGDEEEKVQIKFLLTNHVMTLKNALENKYISAEKVQEEYPNILVKQNKYMDQGKKYIN